MLLQARDPVENLFRQRRISVLNVGQRCAADVLDLLDAKVRLFYLRQCGNDDTGIAPHHFRR